MNTTAKNNRTQQPWSTSSSAPPSQRRRYLSTLAALAVFLPTSVVSSSASANNSSAELITLEIPKVTEQWSSAALPEDHRNNGVVLAQTVTHNGTDVGAARIHIGDQLQVKYQEATGDDVHTQETMDFVSFFDDPADLGLPAEAGTLVAANIGSSGQSFTVPFQRSYTYPLVFAQVRTHNGPDPLYAFVSSVDNSNGTMTIKVTEPPTKDGYHVQETIDYIVIEAGEYTLSDGRKVIARSASFHSNITFHLSHEFDGDAAIIARQQADNGGYNPVRVDKEHDVDNDLTDVILNPAYTNLWTPIAILAIGAAWDPTLPGSVQLTNSNNAVKDATSFAGLEPGHCRELDHVDLGPYEFDVLEFTAWDGLRSSVVLYEGPHCTGAATAYSSNGSHTTTLSGTARTAMSMRMQWTSETTLDPTTLAGQWQIYDVPDPNGPFNPSDPFGWGTEPVPGVCFDPGYFEMGTEMSRFVFEENGQLVHYLINPSEGTIWPTWVKDTQSFCYLEGHGFTFDLDQPATHGDTLTLDDDCMVSTDTTPGWIGPGGCHTNAPPAAPTPAPSMLLESVDVDGDGVVEAAVVATMFDGSGYIVADPLGVLDHVTRRGSLPIPDGFMDDLSPTQLSVLQGQVSGFSNLGLDLEQTVLSVLQGSESASYPALSFSEKGPSGSFSTSLAHGQTTVFGGDLEADAGVVEYHIDGSNYEFELTAAQVTSNNGIVSTEISVGQVSAVNIIEDDRVMFGSEANLVSATKTAGNEDGSHLSASAGIGIGSTWGGSWGHNDQYGVTGNVYGIGISVYIKGEDAVAAWSAVVNYQDNVEQAVREMMASEEWTVVADTMDEMGLSDVGEFFVADRDSASGVVSRFSISDGDVEVFVSSGFDWYRAIVDKGEGANAIDYTADVVGTAGNGAVDIMNDTSADVLTIIEDSTSIVTFNEADIAGAIAESMKSPQDMIESVNTAGNNAGNTAEEVITNVLCGIFGC